MKKKPIRFFRNWKEIESFVIITLILTVIFSYPYNSPIYVLVVVLVVLLLNMTFTKFASRTYGVESELKLWTLKRYHLGKNKQLPKKMKGRTIYSFPAGMIFPLIFTLLSKGFFPFPLVSTYGQEETHRIGKLRSHLLEWEHAKIMFFGILPLLFLMPILNYWKLTLPLFITSMFILGQLLPLPGSNGIYLLFSSRTFYVFLVVLYFSMMALLAVVNIALILILAFTFALLVTFFYYYNFEPS
jgi:hypothetical protein